MTDAKKNHVIVSWFGELYRLPHAQWCRYVLDRALGEDVRLGSYQAEHIGRCYRAADLTPEQAARSIQGTGDDLGVNLACFNRKEKAALRRMVYDHAGWPLATEDARRREADGVK